MNGDSEKFDVKMVVLKYIRHESAPSHFEFIADDQDQSLADLVVPSIRNDFKSTEDKHFASESKDGQLYLFKILKSLKLYNWKLLTSNAFAIPGSSSSVETFFYYEKALGSTPAPQPTGSVASVASKYTYNLKRTAPPVQNDTHSSTQNNAESSSSKTGNEEEKSTSAYTQKPQSGVPVVPLRHYIPPATTTSYTTNTTSTAHTAHNEDSSGTSADPDYSLKRVSTNREKLLQKYNQHRRLSVGKSTSAEAEAPPSPTRASALNKPTINSTPAAATAATTTAAPVVAAAAPAVTAPVAAASAHATSPAHSNTNIHSTNNTTFGSTPPPTPLTSTSNATLTPADASSRVSAASAYPSLVRRVSATKGFVQVGGTNTNAVTSSSGATTAGDVTPKSMSRVPSNAALDSHNNTHSSSTSEESPAVVSRPPSFSLKHNVPAPPTAPLPASIAAASVAAHSTSSANNTSSNSINATTSVNVTTTHSSSSATSSMPVVSVQATVPSTTSAPSLAVAKPVEDEEELSEEPVFRISSFNPLTAPSRPVQSSVTPPTPEADQHEVSRTNHYSKLGSAFFSGNALGPGARRSGGRGSGYLSSLNK